MQAPAEKKDVKTTAIAQTDATKELESQAITIAVTEEDQNQEDSKPEATVAEQSNSELADALSEPKNEGDDLFSLAEFLQGQLKEDQVKYQLASNKYVQRKCRFEDGYIYQPVFSCQTCYEEMLVQKGHKPAEVFAGCKSEAERHAVLEKLVEPHGFCVACMLHCHEGHDVHELYSKLDFRCDCGNGRFPCSCQIDGSTSEAGVTATFEGKPHNNDQNRYNSTYFDLYCMCRKPHQEDLIENYMVQCFNCEDWFHNQHLLPPMLTKQLDEEFILICRQCLPKIGKVSQVIPYADLFHPSCRKAFQMCYKLQMQEVMNNQSQKRQRLSDGVAATSTVTSSAARCCQSNRSQVDYSIDTPALDLVISDKFLDVICECEKCEAGFSRIKKLVQAIDNRDEALKALENNLEGEVNNEEESKGPASGLLDTNPSLNLSTNSSTLNPEMGSLANQTVPENVDQAKVISDYLLSKFFDNLDQQKYADMTKNMSPDAQFYVSKNLQDLREKFAGFVSKYIQPGQQNGNKVIRTEDVMEFFEEMSQLRRQNLARQMSGDHADAGGDSSKK